MSKKGLPIIGQETQEKQNGLSRRSFLKVLGSASTLGLAACASDADQKVLPFLSGDDSQITGVAVWYNSTCTECAAGCGIQVRTREGRAVKLEGNPDNPINRGGLCALGQSGLQAHYDPDRIREPLERVSDDRGRPAFRPISWEAAFTRIASALKTKGKKAFVSGEISGAADELLNSFCEKFDINRLTYELLDPADLAKASETVYGVKGIPEFRFDKAEVVLNFGADFLETWINPCGYAKDWAVTRKTKHPTKVIHIEPRMSLTSANADLRLINKPGSELSLALSVLKILVQSGKGEGLSPEVLAGIKGLVQHINLEEVSSLSGITTEKILLVAHALTSAKSSLVVAGGVASHISDPQPLLIACSLMNLVLGNVGETVNLAALRQPKTSLAAIRELSEALKKGEHNIVFVYRSNPAFTLPSSFGFKFALRSAGLVVSFSSHLDETSELADLILPSHTSLESWGDVRAVTGVYGLVQPAMTPIFNTKNFGDSLLQLAKQAGDTSIAQSAEDFEGYLKNSWEKLYAELGVQHPAGFQRFWLESIERGGYYAPKSDERPKVKVSPDAFKLKNCTACLDAKDISHDSVVLYPFVSVKSFDGRAANRPWLQELPDPISKIVWDSWAEIHPKTAAKFSLAKGDMVTVRNHYGEVNVPVYLTDLVSEGMVAVPIGQGHTSYGRFAKKVGGGNVIDLLPPAGGKDLRTVALLSTRAELIRGRGASKVVNVQGSDSQLGRDLAQSVLVTTIAGDHGDHGEHSDHAGHHAEVPQMYKQREHPLYRWGMAIDLASCTGCSACVVACYAENNIPVVGKKICSEGREMSWLRIERYIDGAAEELQVNFLPMLCQHCNNAPCEPVCPVYATYHNEEGLNAMVYNRCVGTRYCSNNCSYKARRFNWYETEWPELYNWQLNPDVTKRSVGVMEKCTFCIQRIAEARDHAKDDGRMIKDGEVKPACVQGCPADAITFGNLNDPESAVSKLAADARAYKVLDHHINTQPAISYLRDLKYKV